MDAAAIVALVGLCLQYGVPAVQAAVTAYNQPVITLDDVNALHNLVKPPETY
jgi:SpoU rRNA methylase family enzyme